MRFKIGNFQVEIEKKQEEMTDRIAIPTAILDGKPNNFNWKNKTRDFNIFSKLYYLDDESKKYYVVLRNIFDFIDLIEVMKGFNGNKLDTSKTYNINNKFTARISQFDGIIKLEIYFKNYQNPLFLDKFESSSLAAKFGKVLQRCEVWEEQEIISNQLI